MACRTPTFLLRTPLISLSLTSEFITMLSSQLRLLPYICQQRTHFDGCVAYDVVKQNERRGTSRHEFTWTESKKLRKPYVLMVTAHPLYLKESHTVECNRRKERTPQFIKADGEQRSADDAGTVPTTDSVEHLLRKPVLLFLCLLTMQHHALPITTVHGATDNYQPSPHPCEHSAICIV